MKLIVILSKIIVFPFYRRNIGFFLFFLFFFFGTIQPESLVVYHLSILQSLLASYITLGGATCLWFLYNYKCVAFFYNTLKDETGQFIYQLQALPPKKQTSLLFCIHLLLFLPVLLYLLVLIIFAWQEHMIIQATLLMAFIFFIFLGSTIFYYSLVNKSWANSVLYFPKRKRTIKPKPFVLYLVYYAWHHMKKRIGLLKLFSVASLYIALVLNQESFSHDTLVLFLLVILLVHSLIAFHFVHFIEKQLLFLRNLPLSAGRIFMVYYLAYCILFLPDFIYLLIAGFQLLPFYQIVCIGLTLIHTLTLFTAVQYSGKIDQHEFVKIIFGISFVSIFFFNSEQYALWSLLLFLMAALLFFTNYREYDAIQE